ncbi:M20/M25/M40 family metallo-hydrolase [Sporolactobacillus shoreicorticis]|uniref:M20/M25/M40 family metallo-hydrolase n=1 Tax=Sporolactobacillus shoreicorticis TaxID=1923877 RepID=A0ABW5S7X9_9BACL|nr:M20/M25/M40 family metallo-hydrolase [Sporolactobacillus shoreicorticis]MCO7126548.1 M20/M25/M40 family metallo-hydrolase [Sporolactobacillus shoreicorticis]
MSKWQTKEALIELLSELVHVPSVSGSQAEKEFPELILHKLSELNFFQTHPKYLNRIPTDDGRSFISAFVRAPKPTAKTAILFSHFDVVDVQDYGQWKDFAFDIKKLTDLFYAEKESLPHRVRNDLKAGRWLFGRGAMDMKSGLALHMSLIENACSGEFDGNLLLISVPDEEVNSVGMRAAVPHLLELKERYDLDYRAALNSEPMFSLYPEDRTNYIYTGSIGKIMPGFLCYGKETHVGEPFSGLNGNLMASFVTEELELSTELCDEDEGKVAPPPSNLIQKGLKNSYSVQIPHRSVTLFNLFILERSIDEITELLLKKADRAAKKIEALYQKQARQYAQFTGSIAAERKVKVLPFEKLVSEARTLLGEAQVNEVIDRVVACGKKDDREISIQIVDQLAIRCKTLAPMIVLFYAPPFYPAVQSHRCRLIQETVEKVQNRARETDHIELTEQHYFSGISDLSYIGIPVNQPSMNQLIRNMPVWNRVYSIPFEAMEQLSVPVLNLGPIGRDAHQWTERLDVDFAFGPLKDLLTLSVHQLLNEN